MTPPGLRMALFNSKALAESQASLAAAHLLIASCGDQLAAVIGSPVTAETFASSFAEFLASHTQIAAAHTELQGRHAQALLDHTAALAARDAAAAAAQQTAIIDALASAGVPHERLPARTETAPATEADLEDLASQAEAASDPAEKFRIAGKMEALRRQLAGKN